MGRYKKAKSKAPVPPLRSFANRYKYTPINVTVYTAAFSGAISGLVGSSRWLEDGVQEDYAGFTEIAGAFAKSFDEVWEINPNTNPPNTLQVFIIEKTCKAVWESRNARPNSSTTDSSTFTIVSEAIVALVLASDSYFSNQGIVPNQWPITSGIRVPWIFTEFFVDPQNSSGLANDDNDGLTRLTPILTTMGKTGFNQRIFLHDVAVDCVVTYMSDDVAGAKIDLSTISIALNPLATGSLTFQGSRVVLHSGGTINTGTIALNATAPGGGQRQTVHVSDLSTFAPYIPTLLGGTGNFPCRLLDNVTGDGVWLVSGVETASATQPVDNDGNVGSIVIGNGYQISRGSILGLASTGSPVMNGPLIFYDFDFAMGTVGPNINTSEVSTFNVNMFRCSFQDTLQMSGEFIDCVFMSGLSGSISIFLFSGLYIPDGTTGSSAGYISMGDNIYIAQPTVDNIFTVGSTIIQHLFIFTDEGFDGGAQIQDSIANGIFISSGSSFTCETLLWGNGNAGVGVSVDISSQVSIGTHYTFPTITGATGDFGFIPPADSATILVARAWDDSTGAYTEAGGPATRATTWTNLAAPIGSGGFAGQAHYNECGSCLVIN
jgi:hypothetical protein